MRRFAKEKGRGGGGEGGGVAAEKGVGKRGCESATGKEEKNIVAVCRRREREWNGASGTVGSKSREDRRTVREKSVGGRWNGGEGRQKEGERRCSRRNDNEMG